jgi:hypothetical protein
MLLYSVCKSRDADVQEWHGVRDVVIQTEHCGEVSHLKIKEDMAHRVGVTM